MALSGLTLDGRGSQQMEREVEDEFTCAGVLRGALVALQPSVERVFGVKLMIGGEETLSAQNGLIWLQLRGSERDVDAAKMFVKGVVNQEAQKEIQFPEVLHCVFCGAKGLFMDCLIKNTSAHIVVGSQGFLLITGLAEPVVKAYSFITDLVEKYKSSQGRRIEAGLGIAGESLESRRAFKCLVENLEDRHTLDLLVLPVMVKEALLDLVKQSGLDSYSKQYQEGLIPLEGNGSWAMQRSVDEIVHRGSNHNAENSHSQQPQSSYDRVNDTDDFSNESHNQFSQGFILDPTHFEIPESPERETESETPAVLSSTGSTEEFEHLLKFFTAMGFTEDVVRNVLARTGPKEASQILDLIQQEHEKTEQSNPNAKNKDNAVVISDETHEAFHILEASDGGEANTQEEDFVLGVLKKAAATCGYTEDRVMEVYGNLPELKPHELLMQLQKQEAKKANGTRNGSKGADWTIEPNSVTDIEKLDIGSGKGATKLDVSKPLSIHSSSLSVKGPPQTTYSFETMNPEPQPMNLHAQSPPRSIKPNMDLSFPNLSNHTIAPKPRPGKAGAAAAASVVTGPQRFLESLKTPFKLQLSDEPGDPMLRQVIIDGSNVAMSHGLGVFFSCRGIALAVQHFWGRGHREITVFIPQWRQKNNSKNKEKHYLTELHDLGFISYTPSREVEGKRINSYDDRFMLALAQKTNGVIVTNDNLRDLVDESPAWRDIIKKSLLQYVFAGDLFMLPDDPLGRGGPHLRDFLHKHNSSSPVPGSHTFAGASTSFPSPSPAPRAHTEILQYRDWTQGGRGQGSGSDQEVRERTAEETLKLQQRLVPIFPDQESVIIMILQCHPTIRDMDRLTELILEQQE
ncbi:protein KHNYN isoform X1 [Ctenopharyngodon idella]|uniref:protein KHNYN isoform X1 n=1 Tax=Ctenopharyngodon idella TaxID=7959 RepID=UPI00222EE8F2|nr:protein KHNYN isoform X1 [Ctenopharyngodon idella]